MKNFISPDIPLSYLKDESNFYSNACKKVYIPENNIELFECINDLILKKEPITFSGNRTGITGGCVALEGSILSLSKLKKINDIQVFDKYCLINLEPGITLNELDLFLNDKKTNIILNDKISSTIIKQFNEIKKHLFFPADPTENTASLGGVLANNASGARTYYYNSIRNYITEIDVINSKGKKVSYTCEDKFDVKSIFDDSDLNILIGDKIKNSAGYYIKPDLSTKDLLIGSEGTLACIYGLTIKLIFKPELIVGNCTFFNTNKEAYVFSKKLKEFEKNNSLNLSAIEYFDSNAINLLCEAKQNKLYSDVPLPPSSSSSAIYFELFTRESELDNLFNLLKIFLNNNKINESDVWTGTNEKEIIKLKNFRHAIPCIVNEKINFYKKNNPDIHKIGTDMAVPASDFETLFNYYYQKTDESGLNKVCFGHIGNNHIHMNMIPKNNTELLLAKKILLKFAEKTAQLGGTISAEHGIGKIKKDLFEFMYPSKTYNKLREIKRIFDKKNLFNRNNIFNPDNALEIR